jgi:hypothetical protein
MTSDRRARNHRGTDLSSACSDFLRLIPRRSADAARERRINTVIGMATLDTDIAFCFDLFRSELEE